MHFLMCDITQKKMHIQLMVSNTKKALHKQVPPIQFIRQQQQLF
jgi:hypothetical protein